MQFLGIKISEVSKEQARQKVAEFLSGGQHTIFTPNPEMVVQAQKDSYFCEVLNAGDLNLCDGKGLQIFTGIKRIPGVDFMLEICQLAAERGSSVYLLGSGSDEVVKKTAEELQKQFSGLKIAGYDKGPVISENFNCHSRQSGNPADNCLDSHLDGNDSAVIEKINQAKPDILFVAFGSPKQEKWIYENLSKMPSVKIAMGVGGSFDFISGKVKRAPLFLRRLGLEWMYRLIQEPRRFGRIFNATVKFCYLVIKNHIYEKKI